MSASGSVRDGGRAGDRAPFAHEAFLYESPGEHEARCTAYIEEGLDAGEHVLVALPSARLAPLQERFARAGHRVAFAAMEEMGRNPSWLIPAWTDHVAALVRAGRPGRGIGEPAWPGRRPDELVECQRHEALLNLAFADAAGFSLLCPYDAGALPPAVIEGAHHTHPAVQGSGDDERRASDRYRAVVPVALSTPLPSPPDGVTFTPFTLTTLGEVRAEARRTAAAAGLPRQREADLAVAVTEAATNSVVHADGGGEVALWVEDGRAVCEVRDRGRIADPLHGRRRPALDRPGGRGLWLIHQLADLVQHRHTPGGQALRIHVG